MKDRTPNPLYASVYEKYRGRLDSVVPIAKKWWLELPAVERKRLISKYGVSIVYDNKILVGAVLRIADGEGVIE